MSTLIALADIQQNPPEAPARGPDADLLKRARHVSSSMFDKAAELEPLWNGLAHYLYPNRYASKMFKESTQNVRGAAGSDVYDSTPAQVLVTLSNGLLNGITSPSRPWLQLYSANNSPNLLDVTAKQALDDIEATLLAYLSLSNFYTALGQLYRDMGCFGTAAMLILEDEEAPFHCYTLQPGTFAIRTDGTGRVSTLTRRFTLELDSAAELYGTEWMTDEQRNNLHGPRATSRTIDFISLFEPNTGPHKLKNFKWRETVWTGQQLVTRKGYEEKPFVVARWEVNGQDTYGTSPAMLALPDIQSLQHLAERKHQAMDMLVWPPLLVEGTLATMPTALTPGSRVPIQPGMTFGAKPVYTTTPPLAEITNDILRITRRIEQAFFIDLFQAVSQLDTVRSATEVLGRQEERMVLLGGVLERFEREVLDPSIRRIANILRRNGLLELETPADQLTIQYISILAIAQRAAGTAPTERFLQFVAQLAGISPEVLLTVNFDGLLRDYAMRLDVPGVALRSVEEVQAMQQAQAAQQDLQQTVQLGAQAAEGAKSLAQADTGGGQNALQQLLGGLGG